MEKPALITIGMPVRNEARFIRQTLDSLVVQATGNLELLISDNASTDTTPDICLEYASRYPFIRYHRFEENVGASENFGFVLREARGDYFMWAAGHDLWDPNFASECGSLLDRFPGAVLAFGCTRWVDAEGQPYPKSTGWSDTRGTSAIGRYCTVFWGNMNPILALMRTEALRSQKIENITGEDFAILLGLALRGDFVHAANTNWYRREFRRETTYAEKLARYRSKDFGIGVGKSFLARYLPLAQLPLRILGDLFASQLSFGQKLLLSLIVLPSLLGKYVSDKAVNRASAPDVEAKKAST